MAARPVLTLEPVEGRAGPIRPSGLLTWMRYPAHRAAVLAWPAVLLPDFLAGRHTMAADSVERYQRVEWRRPIPETELEVSVRGSWAEEREGRTQYEMLTEVRSGGELAGRSRIVCVTAAAIEPFGRPFVPASPQVGPVRVVRPFTVSDADVRDFSEQARTHYLVTGGTGDARGLGFRNSLVPGPMLTALHLAAWDEPPEAGWVEVWFKGPVAAGAAMSLCRTVDGRSWSIQAVGEQRAATVCQGGSGAPPRAPAQRAEPTGWRPPTSGAGAGRPLNARG
jgi:hypothetical protein